MTKKVCEQKCFSLPKLRIYIYWFVWFTKTYFCLNFLVEILSFGREKHFCSQTFFIIYINTHNNKQFCISYVFQSYLKDFVILDLIFKS